MLKKVVYMCGFSLTIAILITTMHVEACTAERLYRLYMESFLLHIYSLLDVLPFGG